MTSISAAVSCSLAIEMQDGAGYRCPSERVPISILQRGEPMVRLTDSSLGSRRTWSDGPYEQVH